jgi:hypothetical protein
LKLQLQDRITIENKVIERLVEPESELILTPPAHARKTNKWRPNLWTKKPKRHSVANTKAPIEPAAIAARH